MFFIKEAWERFLLYLPLVFMGLLALGTYWLVRSTPTVVGATVAAPVRHEPDYFMEGFSVRTFDAAGRVRTEILGDKARHYPDTPWIEIDAIRIRTFDEQGRLTTASANQGLTNEDSTEVQLVGNAIVVREPYSAEGAEPTPRMEYRSEFLHAFTKTERVVSDKPIELIRGQDRFTANSFEFDNAAQTLELRGRVRGTLAPRNP